MSRILIGATNYGVWAEELQAPWDALTKAGHEVTLATPRGVKPLPLAISVDPDFVDPIQNVRVNPPEVCARVKEILDGDEWNHPISFEQASMDDFEAIVLTGGPGATAGVRRTYAAWPACPAASPSAASPITWWAGGPTSPCSSS